MNGYKSSSLGISVLEWLNEELKKEADQREQDAIRQHRAGAQLRASLFVCLSGISFAVMRFLEM